MITAPPHTGYCLPDAYTEGDAWRWAQRGWLWAWQWARGTAAQCRLEAMEMSWVMIP